MTDKIKVLCLSTSTNNVHTFLGSLECLDKYEITKFFYDEKFNRTAHQRINQSQQHQQHYQQTGQIMPPVSFDDASMDDEIVAEVKNNKPDVIVYISAWTGPFVPLNETFQEINALAPVIHFLCDGADEPWWDKLKEFERRKQFSLTVNIDGNHFWPGGKDWFCTLDTGYVPISNGLTLLTPLDMRPFMKLPTKSYEERPYAITFAGNSGTAERNAIIKKLATVPGFEHRPRDQHPGSYGQFVEWLQNTRVTVSVPFTGSGQARHVKGRVLEAGLTGSCLLEWRNSATASWFDPRKDYWEYSSIEECAEYAAWLSSHPRVANEIAVSLSNRVNAEHHPKIFWSKVFAAVGK